MQTGQGQPSYEGGSVNFPTQLQVTQYNELMTGLQNQYQQLLQAQNSAGALLCCPEGADRTPPALASCCWMEVRLAFVLPARVQDARQSATAPA